MIAEPAPTFAVKLASAADPAELEAWLAAARAGERAQYASGIDLPRDAAGVVLVTRWVAEGRVRTFSRRDRNDARRWQFLVEKIETTRGRATSCARVSGPPSKPYSTRNGGRVNSPHDVRGQLSALMDLLRARAGEGQPCPGYGETAKMLGLPRGQRGKRRAQYLFKRLADERRIAVTWPGTGQVRIVTIAKGRGQGLSTAPGPLT